MVWIRQIHLTSWVAYRGDSWAIAEGVSRLDLLAQLKDLGIDNPTWIPLRILRVA